MGTHFDLSINGTKTGQAGDGTYDTGLAALLVGPDMEAILSNLTIAQPQ